MKIQSSLLVLAAMVGSATAANKRKRVFKIYSREEIQAAEATRSLQGGGGKNQGGNNKDPAPEVVPAVMSMSMTLSPSGSPTDASIETIITSAPTAMSMMTKCAFCHGVIMTNPDLDLGVQSQTCGTVKMAVSTMDATDANCALAKQAEAICCPPVVETTTTTSATTTAAMMSMPTTTEAADIVETETTTTATEAAIVPVAPTPLPPTPPSPTPDGAPSGAMTMETTLAAVTVVAGAMMLV
eukprot:scaffold773_cov140-Skeletonema_marinoi.AAC.9